MQVAGTLGGGEQQRLAVGRAVSGRRRLLMLGEASLGLAPKMVEELLAVVCRIRDDGVTILLVEQNVAQALAIGAGAYVIERGAVAMRGAAKTLLSSETLRAAYLGADIKPGTLTWKGGLFMNQEQTTAVTIAAEHAWRGKVFSGRWQVAKGGTRQVIEPATGKVLTEVGFANAEDVRDAARSAAAAQVEWAATPAEHRAAVIRRAAQSLRACGRGSHGSCARPLRASQGGLRIAHGRGHPAGGRGPRDAAVGAILPSGPKRMSFAARAARRVGVSPFNAPLILQRVVGPALALGNAVVLKPDPNTPVSGGFLIARLFEAAGLPEGLLHVLPGDAAVGEAMIADPNIAMISFTGSTAAGRRVGELASRHLKKVTLELGGKNPLIVCDDADLDVAASSVAWGAYLHQGQICMSTGTVLAHKSIAAKLTEKLAEKANKLPVGDPNVQKVALGPIISKRQIDRIDGIVKEAVAKGARLRAGSTYENLFYKPTVLDKGESRHARVLGGGLRPGGVRGSVRPTRRRSRSTTRPNMACRPASSRSRSSAMNFVSKLKTGIIRE